MMALARDSAWTNDDGESFGGRATAIRCAGRSGRPSMLLCRGRSRECPVTERRPGTHNHPMTNIIIHFSDGTSFDHETQKVGKDAIWEAIAAACRVCSDDTITEIEVVNG